MHIHPTCSFARTWLAALLAAGAIGPAGAAGPPKDISREISDLRSTVVSAEVWITPGRFESRDEITEEVLRKVGCAYRATETQDLGPLLDILVSAGFVEHDHPEPLDTLVAIYLTTRSGAVIPLLLDMEFSNAPSLGKYNGMTPVVARKGFETALRTWTALRKSTGPKAYCQK